MKVALYGNVCNNMFAIAKSLHKLSDWDVHLYLPQNADFSNLPENDEPELCDNYPGWIHRSRDYNLGAAFSIWTNNIIKELRKYDLIILSSLTMVLAPYLRKSKIYFFVTGGDLTVLPFKDIHRTLLYSGKSFNLKPIIYQIFQRRGIARADRILTQPFFPFVNALKKLQVPESKIANSYFPIIVDTDRFQCRPAGSDKIANSIQGELDRFKFKIFHPSRIVIDPHPHLRETGQCKRNDILIRSFATFITDHKITDAGLYLIDRRYGLEQGIFELKKLIAELKIEKFVIWLQPENCKGFTRDELIDVYSRCNLVADDYGAGWFGSICVEGFSCSKPVLSYVDQTAMSTIYKWHPFLSSNTVKGNADLISKCYFDADFCEKQGKLGRNWALEYHSPTSAGRKYVREFEKLLADVS